MKTRWSITTAMVWVAVAAMAQGLAVEINGRSSPAFSHPRDITHPFLPLGSLKQDILEGKEGAKAIRVERTAKPEMRKTFKIGGQIVEALAVEDREFENGRLAEVAVDFFAQSDDGTVYYLGETVDEYNKGGQVSGHSGAWMLGVDTPTPGVLLPANPKVGDKFRSEDAPKITREDDVVVSLTETVKTPSGTYQDCLKVKEVLSDGKIEFKFYAKGVGCVKEAPEEGELLLKSHAVVAPSGKTQNSLPPASQGGQSKEEIQDPTAREALAFVGVSPYAEAYWYGAINDPTLSAHERQDLIEDLNEDGISDPEHPTTNDLPLILSRIELLLQIGGNPMDQVNADAFHEAYKDLTNMASSIYRGGRP